MRRQTCLNDLQMRPILPLPIDSKSQDSVAIYKFNSYIYMAITRLLAAQYPSPIH